jgi:hypothetical protein
LIFALKSEVIFICRTVQYFISAQTHRLGILCGGTGFEYANLAYDESNSNSSLEEVFLSFPPEDKSQQADLTKWETLSKLDKGSLVYRYYRMVPEFQIRSPFRTDVDFPGTVIREGEDPFWYQ